MNTLKPEDQEQIEVTRNELHTLKHFAKQVSVSLKDTNALMGYAKSIRAWVFNGPVGLAKNWIGDSNSKAYEHITAASTDSEIPEVKRRAQMILRSTGGYLTRFPRNSRKISWTFSQVRNISELSVNDQDRIVSEELFLQYSDYKSLVNFIGSHPDLIRAVQSGWIWNESDSSKTHGVMLPFMPGTLSQLNDIDWIQVWARLAEGWIGGYLTQQGLMLMIQPDMLIVSRDTLNRFDSIMQHEWHASVRSAIAGMLNDAGAIAARKRGGSGNAPRKTEVSSMWQLSPTPTVI